MHAAANGGAGFRRVLLKLSGEALMGSRDYGIDVPVVRALAEEIAAVHARRRRRRDRRRRRQLLPRPCGRGRGDGANDRRLRRHARHAPERARAPGRARAAGREHPRAVRARGERGRRAVHPAPRDPAPREGPHRHLRRRHRQPVLHDRHRRRAARARDRRRRDPHGEERRRGRLRRRPARRIPTRGSCRGSRTSRRSSAA